MLFCFVKETPTDLDKDEYVINAPSFMDEVVACQKKKPRSNNMTANYIREIVQMIGAKYIGPDFNSVTDVNISNFVNSPCNSEIEAHESIMRLFKQQYPQMLDAFVKLHIKSRPFGTRFIYYLGSHDQAGVFLEHGFEQVLEKEVVKNKKKKNNQANLPF